MPLTTENPVEINEQNRAELPQSDPSENQRLYESKKFPILQTIGLIFIILLFIIIKNQKSEPEKDNPKKKALLALKQLKAKKLTPEESLSQLSNLLRNFIEEYYEIRANSLTTEQFLHFLSQHPLFDRNTQQVLADFLLRADQVKFAKQKLSQELYDQAESIAETLIYLNKTNSSASPSRV